MRQQVEEEQAEGVAESISVIDLTKDWFRHKALSLIPAVSEIPIPEEMECKEVIEDEESGFKMYLF